MRWYVLLGVWMQMHFATSEGNVLQALTGLRPHCAERDETPDKFVLICQIRLLPRLGTLDKGDVMILSSAARFARSPLVHHVSKRMGDW